MSQSISATRQIQSDHLAAEAPIVLHTRVVTGTGGGPEKTILNSPRFLEQLGYKGLCAYMHPHDDSGFEILRKRALDAGTALISIPDRGIRDLSVFRRLLAICKSEKVDIWHAHDYKSNFVGLVLRRFWPMKLVTTSHGWVKFTKRTPIYHFVDRFCQRHYDRVLCVSPDIYETCLEHGVSRDKCLLIDNAIDHRQYQRTMSVEAAKSKCGFPAERLLIGAVGRLSSEKGFDVLIRSVSRLLEQGHDIQLAIAGEGDARPQLDQLIQQQSRPERFQLLGHRNDILELLQAMDVFALSSYREGLPNVLLEAMALEVPVVATRIAGIPRLVQTEQNGLLVEAGDETQLTKALQRLLSDATLRAQYAAAGRETIEQDFSFEHRMKKIAKIYDDLLEHNQ